MSHQGYAFVLERLFMSKLLTEVFKGIALTGQIKGIFDDCVVENVYMNKDQTKLYIQLQLREIVHPQMLEVLESKIHEFVADWSNGIIEALQ